MTDYQWPSSRSPLKFFRDKVFDIEEMSRQTKSIENFFESRLKCSAILMPSGRASISLIVRHLGLNRNHVVFAPKWTSQCVWDSIVPYSNPTISLDTSPDLAIAVHKWGRASKFRKPFRGHIIEDSVDSIFKDETSLFANGGEFEILSLPKIIGSSGGGVILTQSQKSAASLRELLAQDSAFSRSQSYFKYLDKNPQQRLESELHFDWRPYEHANTRVDGHDLKDIGETLENYDLNTWKIESRLHQVIEAEVFNDHLDHLSTDRGRLPPNLPLPASLFRENPRWRLCLGSMISMPLSISLLSRHRTCCHCTLGFLILNLMCFLMPLNSLWGK